MAPVTSPTERDRERVGPHPSYIEIAKPYILQTRIQKCLTDISMSDAKEDAARLQGVAWIDQVRRALQLPIRTFNTAVIYYHKFRLLHSDNEYNWADASAAALFTACKIEDTLKKSREILCANWNLKVGPGESLSSDDPRFENHSKLIIGLERLMLESAGFDFRNRYPQKLMVKLIRALKMDRNNASKTAWNLSIDLYRTFAPLKQSTPTLAIACVELAARLHEMDTSRIVDAGILKYNRWASSRAEVMETLLDLLDLYTHHRGLTSVGPLYTLEAFINIRIGLNQEASAADIPRYALYKSDSSADVQSGTNGFKPRNGIDPTSPLTPATPGTVSPGNAQAPTSAIGIRGQNGTVRFMLDAARARDERNEVDKFHKIEEEEYEVEVPIDNRPEDRDKRSRDFQDHQDPWQPDYNEDRVEDFAELESRSRGSQSSYWDKFRKRSEAPKEIRHHDSPIRDGGCSDNVNYFGELDLPSRDTPQRTTGRDDDNQPHKNSAVRLETRNDRDPPKKNHRQGRERQKRNKQVTLDKKAAQLRESSYDGGRGLPRKHTLSNKKSFGMPADWGKPFGNWGFAPMQHTQLTVSFANSDVDHDRRGRRRRSSLIDRRGGFVREPSHDRGPRRPSNPSCGESNTGYQPYQGPYSPPRRDNEDNDGSDRGYPVQDQGRNGQGQSSRGRLIDRQDDIVRELSFDRGLRRLSSSSYGDYVTEYPAYQAALNPPRQDDRDVHSFGRDDKRASMPYATRLNNFRKQQERQSTRNNNVQDTDPFIGSGQNLQGRIEDHGGERKNPEGRETVQDTTDFVHPDRARRMSPENNRKQNDGGRSLKRSKPQKGPANTKKTKSNTKQATGRLTPVRTPEPQKKSDSHPPGQDRERRSSQAPQSREASKGLSAEDGHQWARDANMSNRGRGRDRGKGGMERGKKHTHQGGGLGRRNHTSL